MAPTFETLPVELRCRVYTLLFSGKKLGWAHYLNKAGWASANFLSIRFVCKRCLRESESIFFRAVQIDLTNLVDNYYACLYPNIDLNLFNNVKIVLLSEEEGAAVSIVQRMPNLKSLTVRVYGDLDDEPLYGFSEEDCEDGKLSRYMMRFIHDRPWRILGVDDDGVFDTTKEDLCEEMRSVIDNWRKCNHSFKLFAEMDVSVENRSTRWVRFNSVPFTAATG